MSRRGRVVLLIVVTLAAAVATALLPRLPQAAIYHQFADQRTFLGIPHCLDMLSNLVFLIVGGLGLGMLFRPAAAGKRVVLTEARERWPHVVFFVGAILTGLGSAYYHWAPDNARLFWDRLPMTIAFMAFLSAVIAERIEIRVGVWLLGPLLLLGASSVVYWIVTERHGAGDLRLYGFVHFYPVVLVPLILLLFPPRYTRGRDLMIMLAWYGAAKGVEVLDTPIYTLGRIVSGHTLKHFLAALAIYWYARMLWKRTKMESA